MITVTKRNGRGSEEFTSIKIVNAVARAQSAVRSSNVNLPLEVAEAVHTELLEDNIITIEVDDIHKLVENYLMDNDHDVAREYISYRKEHMPDIFRPRETILPYEYPDVMQYVEAIRQSHWIHTEYDYDQDVRDYYNPNIPQQYKTVYARCLLAISQIEVTVKSYWKNVDELFPKHEFSMLAATFDESEARHFDTYRNLLELVDLNDMFNQLDESPVLKARSDSLRSTIKVSGESRKDILLKNIMFSSFIENVSLYSQFLILKSFAELMSLFKGTANGVDATSTEEVTHFLAGVHISKKIIEENPTLLDTSMRAEILDRAHAGVREEYNLIDWLFDGQDLPFLTREQVKQFIAIRMHDSLITLGIVFLEKEVLKEYRTNLSEFDWFSDKEKVLMQTDFFAGRETSYSKGTRTFTGDSLFNEEFKQILGDLNVSLDR